MKRLQTLSDETLKVNEINPRTATTAKDERLKAQVKTNKTDATANDTISKTNLKTRRTDATANYETLNVEGKTPNRYGSTITNVTGLDNSSAGKSTTTGVLHAQYVFQNVDKVSIGSCNQESHEQREAKYSGQTSESLYGLEYADEIPSDDQSRNEEIRTGKKKVIPTRTALQTAEKIFDTKKVTLLVGNGFEGEHIIIDELCNRLDGYTIHKLNDINTFTREYPNLPTDEPVVIVVLDVPDVIKDKNKLADIIAAIKSNDSASEDNRKYIFVCQPRNLKIFQRKMAIKVFDETNTVNLTDINGHPDHWRERLDLMNRFTSTELKREDKERIAKMVPPVGGFPYLCAAYKGEGPEFFEDPHDFAKKQISRLISANDNTTKAAFILMVACKGSCNVLKKYKGVVQAGLLGDASVKSLTQQFEFWRDTILKFENNVWTFTNEIWKRACTMVLYDMKKTLYVYCHKPCPKSKSFWTHVVEIVTHVVEIVTAPYRWYVFLLDKMITFTKSSFNTIKYNLLKNVGNL